MQIGSISKCFEAARAIIEIILSQSSEQTLALPLLLCSVCYKRIKLAVFELFRKGYIRLRMAFPRDFLEESDRIEAILIGSNRGAKQTRLAIAENSCVFV